VKIKSSMAMLGDQMKRKVGGLKVGRSIEEIVVQRRLDLESKPLWPPAGPNPPAKFSKSVGRDGILSQLIRGSTDYDRDSKFHAPNNQLQTQLHDNIACYDYSSMANYCQNLRCRVKVSLETFGQRLS
jgi:hypothetical protein